MEKSFKIRELVYVDGPADPVRLCRVTGNYNDGTYSVVGVDVSDGRFSGTVPATNVKRVDHIEPRDAVHLTAQEILRWKSKKSE